jgi:glycosyltransferase involved in cell wall biosynthesis
MIMAGAHHGGAETFFVRLCVALAGAGEEVLAVIRRDADRASALRRGGLAPVELGFGGPLDLLTRPRLARALGRFAPRVAMAWMNRAARFTPPGPWVRVGRLGGYYDLRYYGGFDHLVGNTQGIVEWIARQGWPRARVHHLPNFAPDLAGAAPVDRAALGVPRDAFLVLTMGRLHPNKGFDVLIEAIAHLPDVVVAIAGEGEERAALTALADRLGVSERVRFLGWRDDQAALLAACDLFVCPSRHEPLGNVVLEAWSAARPVVAASSPGPAELIAHGTTGLLVPVEDARALAEAIAALRDQPARARALAAAGRAAFLRAHAEAPVLARWRGFLAEVAR